MYKNIEMLRASLLKMITFAPSNLKQFTIRIIPL